VPGTSERKVNIDSTASPSLGGRDEFFFGDAERSEGAFWLGLTPPVVDTGKVDVLPNLRGDGSNYVIRQVVAFVAQALDDA
jgi:hypothetical protein